MLVISRRPSRLLGIKISIILVTSEFSSVLEDVSASVSPASLAALAVLAASAVDDVEAAVVVVDVAVVADAAVADAAVVRKALNIEIIYEEPLQESMQGLFISS
jgi:hypothetical protein